MHAKLKGLSQLVSYTSGAFGGSRLRGHVNSESCIACHNLEDFQDKPIIFPRPKGIGRDQKIMRSSYMKPFVHKTHLEFLETGHELQCATCHERRPGDQHMGVHTKAFFQCHFTKTTFNTDRAQCLMCHDLPAEPIQTSGDDPITHQMLEARGVTCASCHSQDVQGSGPVHTERCMACHDTPALLATWEYVKPHKHATYEDAQNCPACLEALQSELQMHKAHVPTQHANCMDCHLEISHGRIIEDLMSNQMDCRACHLETHESTVRLLEGKASMDPDASVIAPHSMQSSHTMCTGCHIQEKYSKGHKLVLRAGDTACVTCHGKDHEVYATWKKVVINTVNEASALKSEAFEALMKADESISGDLKKELAAKLKEADDKYIYIIKAGPLHNQKTTSELLDQAMNTYEDVLDAIEEAVES